MKVLHIDLKPIGKDYAEFRHFWDNPNQYQSRQLPLAQIAGLIDRAETDYYTRLPEEYAKTGQALYNWLDGSDRYLAKALNQHRREGIVLAIAVSKGLAHLPWEILHDGTRFLVETTPAIVPIRWIVQANSQPLIQEDKPANRALNVLFMATSPLGVEPVLDYEAEEGQILSATQRTPVNLQVEESGCLSELGYLVREYEKNYFDIFHLTGHATYNHKPYFLTEDEYGNRLDSDTSAIINALSSSIPPLIFLSGCRTGYSSDPVVASMAEELLSLGATAVLGWGETVRDRDATAAARGLYWELSQGGTVLEALASTYQTLIQQQARDWHKLRLYTANILPGALVTPLRTRGRKQLPKPMVSSEFRDDEKRLRVISRENFVGRRRQLQNCLRTLKTDQEKVGVLLHGMGGLGKSSIASRLWDRLPDFEKVLWWRQIDEPKLIKKLSSKLIKPELREVRTVLESMDDGLEIKLAYLFSQLAELGEKPFLFIFDDFEWNLEPREGHYILKSEVFPILAALISAIREMGTEHRIIITCRYRFDSELLDYFYEQGLESLKKAELAKKLSRLEHFNFQKIPEDLRERALTFAAGNPRLLEFLNDEVLGEKDAQAKLTELEKSPELWKDKIIWKELYELIDEPLQQILSYCLIHEIPVPMEALEVVCESLPNYKQQLNRGLCLGLIEISYEPKEKDQVYHVSRILPHIISGIQLPKDEKLLSFLCGKAGDRLYQLWGKKENENREQWSEIFRLALADKQNPKRFREQFSKMLCVQFNVMSDIYYNIELKINKNELSSKYLFKDLEDYLRKKKWIEADEETTWIFYQIMIVNKYENLFQLYEKISCDTLNKIDQLWLKYSDGCFGFSIQSKIFNELNKTEYEHYQCWIKFCDLVGWRKDEKWLCYSDLFLNLHTCKGTLPALCISHRNLYREGSIWVGGWWPSGKMKENRFDIGGEEDYRLKFSYFISIVSKLKECNL
jgi:CHAT domain-containing protein